MSNEQIRTKYILGVYWHRSKGELKKPPWQGVSNEVPNYANYASAQGLSTKKTAQTKIRIRLTCLHVEKSYHQKSSSWIGTKEEVFAAFFCLQIEGLENPPQMESGDTASLIVVIVLARDASQGVQS